MNTLTAEQANDVYTILIEECGARVSGPVAHLEHAGFLVYMAGHEGRKEWRFGGALGYGGKCRLNDNHPVPYVDYYPEDKTPERDAMVEKANARIRALFTDLAGPSEPAGGG